MNPRFKSLCTFATTTLFFFTALCTFTSGQRLTVLHTFNQTDGQFSTSGLVHGSDGYLYGTAGNGGPTGCGTVFKITPSGKFTSIYSFVFGGNDGCVPSSSVIRDASGNLYGTTDFGGPANAGTVFKIDHSGHESVLYAFKGGSDGAIPQNDLVRDKAGNLYGTTREGGNYTVCNQGCGIVFKINPTGGETILHTFTGGQDGGVPSGGLVMDSSGNLYGPAEIGGLYGYGQIFKFNTAGDLTQVLNFGPALSVDGNVPVNDLAFGPGSILYGTTTWGGDLNLCSNDGCGVIFALSKEGVETVLHIFEDSPSDVSQPSGPIARDTAGNLYGAAAAGGANGFGAVYKLDPAGNETILYSFLDGPDGGFPSGRLYVNAAGTVYGTTFSGGDKNGDGVIFKITP